MNETRQWLLAAGLALGLLLPAVSAPGLAQSRTSLIPGAHREPAHEALRQLNRSDSRMERGDYEGALETALRAARIDSLSSEVFERLGVIYAANRMYGDAFLAFRRASLLEPSSPAHLNRAGQLLLTQLGRPAGAKQAFDQSLRVDERYGPAHYSLFIYHLMRGELLLAQSSIATALESSANELEIASFFGASLNLVALRGNYESALSAYRSHLMRFPTDTRGWQSRLLVERILKLDEEAETTARLLTKGTRPNGSIYNELGMILFAQGKADTAQMALERGWSTDSLSCQAGYNLALFSLSQQDTAGALNWLARVEEREPNWYGAPYLAARIHDLRGDEERAARARARAVRVFPFSMRLEEEAPGTTMLDELAPVTSINDSLLQICEQNLLGGEGAMASHYATRACMPEEGRMKALFYGVQAAKPSGSSQSLQVAQLESARELLTDEDDAVLAWLERELGEAHMRIGNLDDAREHLEAAWELDDDAGGPAAVTVSLGIELALETDDLEAAAVWAERAEGSEDPHLLGWRGVLAEQSGDAAAAANWTSEAGRFAYLPSAPSGG